MKKIPNKPQRPQRSIMKLGTNPDLFKFNFYMNLKLHGKVKVTGIGIFEAIPAKSRMGYDYQSKKLIKMDAYTKIRFTPTKQLKQYVQ